MLLEKGSVIVLLVALTLPFALSAQPKGKSSASQAHSSQSSEMKKEMAEMYQKMADCMKTDKSMHECHKEVMKDCPVAKATGSCPLMDGMKGMMHKGSMKHEKMKDMKMDHSDSK